MLWIARKAIEKWTGLTSLHISDFISFLSRVPDNEELEDYRELKP